MIYEIVYTVPGINRFSDAEEPIRLIKSVKFDSDLVAVASLPYDAVIIHVRPLEDDSVTVRVRPLEDR